MNAPHWFQPESEWACDRCPNIIGTDGSPAAWLPDNNDGTVLCAECADQIEATIPPVPL